MDDDADVAEIREKLANPPPLLDRAAFDAAAIALAEQILIPPPALAPQPWWVRARNWLLR